MPGTVAEEQGNQEEWRVPEENNKTRAGGEDWESSSSTKEPPFNLSSPLLANLRASAVSDSNTRQRQNTQLHKDTRSRLQKNGPAKKRIEAGKGRI